VRLSPKPTRLLRAARAVDTPSRKFHEIAWPHWGGRMLDCPNSPLAVIRRSSPEPSLADDETISVWIDGERFFVDHFGAGRIVGHAKP
jgi:hypothetical protein